MYKDAWYQNCVITIDPSSPLGSLVINAPHFDGNVNRQFHGKVNEQMISRANSESIHTQIQSGERPFIFLTCVLVTGKPESWHSERN